MTKLALIAKIAETAKIAVFFNFAEVSEFAKLP